jgi:hypothetical protein
MAQVGGHVSSPDPRLAQIGLVPGTPLPPLPVFVVRQQGPGFPFGFDRLPDPMLGKRLTEHADKPSGREEAMSEPGHHITLMLNAYGRGGVINSAEMARAFAELILREGSQLLDEPGELDRQLPLVVEDRGDVWYVHGSATDQRAIGDLRFGRWAIAINKFDAKVLRIGYGATYP